MPESYIIQPLGLLYQYYLSLFIYGKGGKREHPLKSGQWYNAVLCCSQVETTDTMSIVSFPLGVRNHSGRYHVVAKNKSGTKHINVFVTVLGT